LPVEPLAVLHWFPRYEATSGTPHATRPANQPANYRDRLIDSPVRLVTLNVGVRPTGHTIVAA